jgi:uncharacterized protein (DUF779 family)
MNPKTYDSSETICDFGMSPVCYPKGAFVPAAVISAEELAL